MPVDDNPTAQSPWFPPAWHMVTISTSNTARRLRGNRDRFASRLLSYFQPVPSANHSASDTNPHTEFPPNRRGAFPAYTAGNRPFWGLYVCTSTTHLPDQCIPVQLMGLSHNRVTPQQTTDWLANTSRTAEHSPQRAPCAFAVKHYYAFPLQRSRHERATYPGFASPSRCALRFSQPLGALLPLKPFQVYFNPMTLMGF